MHLLLSSAMAPKKSAKKGRVETEPPTHTTSSASGTDSETPPPPPPEDGKKKKKKREWDNRKTTRFTLNEEDDIVAWYQGQPHMWMRCHKDYKNDALKRATIQRKAMELKVDPENLKVCINFRAFIQWPYIV